MASEPLAPSSGHTNKPNVIQKMNPMLWRQSRNVKKAVEQVDSYVNAMTTKAPFLLSKKPPPLPEFQRSELTTGRLLGEGSFSTVVEITGVQLTCKCTPEEDARRKEFQSQLAEDRKSKQPGRYALKQVKRDLLRKPQEFGNAIADLVVECKYLSRLDHPNILRVRGLTKDGTDAFESGRYDSYFLVLDRLTDSLDQRIDMWKRQGPPDPTMIPRKANYALQIANALLYLHQRRIIYRDLKPENVGFREEHICQLFDFGLVREVPEGLTNQMFTMSGSGSQFYMAVEIFITGKYNLKADVFSWAVTFYEMLTQTQPFGKMQKLEHVALVCVKGKRPSLSSHKFPKSIEKLIRSAWGQSVSKRPAIVDVVKTLEKEIPELGDEAACSWPTIEYDPSYHVDEDFGADTDDDISLPKIWGDTEIDREIDEEIVEEMQKGQLQERRRSQPTLGDIDDDDGRDYSMSSVFFGEH